MKPSAPVMRIFLFERFMDYGPSPISNVYQISLDPFFSIRMLVVKLFLYSGELGFEGIVFLFKVNYVKGEFFDFLQQLRADIPEGNAVFLDFSFYGNPWKVFGDGA